MDGWPGGVPSTVQVTGKGSLWVPSRSVCLMRRVYVPSACPSKVRGLVQGRNEPPLREQLNEPPGSPVNETELVRPFVAVGGPSVMKGGAVKDLTCQEEVVGIPMFPALSTCLTANVLGPSGSSDRETGDWQAIQADSFVEHWKVDPVSVPEKVIEAEGLVTVPVGAPDTDGGAGGVRSRDHDLKSSETLVFPARSTCLTLRV